MKKVAVVCASLQSFERHGGQAARRRGRRQPLCGSRAYDPGKRPRRLPGSIQTACRDAGRSVGRFEKAKGRAVDISFACG